MFEAPNNNSSLGEPLMLNRCVYCLPPPVVVWPFCVGLEFVLPLYYLSLPVEGSWIRPVDASSSPPPPAWEHMVG